VTTRSFGSLPDGRAVTGHVLGTPPGPVLHVLDLGATVHRLEVTGGDGVRRNVVLGHATPAEYVESTAYLGAVVGRYANRIARGRFVLDGEPVTLAVNDRGNTLHGGPEGFDARVWTLDGASVNEAVFRLTSPDGDQGFPGTLEASVRYRVSEASVRIDFAATTDRSTVVNLTNHAYFNLDGDDAGTVDDHRLAVRADRYLPVDDTGIPTGEFADVAGTPFDFRNERPIGPAIRSDDPQLRSTRGIDHDFALDGSADAPAAVLTSSRTRTRLALFTDQPGVQVYTGNFLDGSLPGAGRLLRQGDGIALEPQLHPDTPNRPEFGSARLDPGQTYRATMEWRFERFG
jgi:aldose 1-epimerase